MLQIILQTLLQRRAFLFQLRHPARQWFQVVVDQLQQPARQCSVAKREITLFK